MNFCMSIQAVLPQCRHALKSTTDTKEASCSDSLSLVLISKKYAHDSFHFYLFHR